MSLLDEQRLQWGRLLELTDLMLQGAHQGQWESVQNLQLIRENQLHGFFDGVQMLASAELATGIQYMLDSDRQLAALGGHQRDALLSQINKLKQGKTAVRAYSAT